MEKKECLLNWSLFFCVFMGIGVILMLFFPLPPSFVGSIGTSFQCHSIHQDHICNDDSDKVRITCMFPSQDAYPLGFFYVLLLLYKDCLFCRCSSQFSELLFELSLTY